MINEMQQVVIAMRRRESEAVITALQDAGVLHIRPLEQSTLSEGERREAASEQLKEAERLLARTESTLAELGAKPNASKPLPTLPERGTWAARIDAVAGPIADLSRERGELSADVDAAEAYAEPVGKLARMVGHLDESRRVAVLPFLLHGETDVDEVAAALRASLDDRFELSVDSYGAGRRVGAVAVLTGERDAARAALGQLRLAELRLPGRFEGLTLSQAATQLEELRGAGRERLGQLNAKRAALAEQHGPELYALRDGLKDVVAVNDVRTASARGKYSLVLEGYVPTHRLSDFKAALEPFGDGVLYEIGAVDAHHDELIPVELEHNSYVKPFRTIMGLMSPPRYGTFDPTWVVALFVPLYFGIIIADIGYGLMFLAFGMWLMGKGKRGESWNLGDLAGNVPAPTVRDIGYVTNVMAVWTIFWGVLTGELFGTLFEHLGFFYMDPAFINSLWGWTGIQAVPHELPHYNLPFHLPPTIPIAFPRLDTELFSGVFLVFTLLFGVLQVLWGWGIRIRQGLKHNDQVHVWEGIALFSGVLALVLLALNTRAASDFSVLGDIGNPITLVMYLLFALFMVGWIRVFKQFPMLPIELLSQGGAVISYARIFAVGLVSAIFAKLASELGLSLASMWGIPGLLIGLLVGIFVHLLILALTLISHVLQPIRLHIVEFLNPTGFNNETSPVYAPLRRRSAE